LLEGLRITASFYLPIVSMVKLRELLALLPPSIATQPDWRSLSHPALEQEVTGFSTNSFACKSGTVFIGMPGTRVDGGNFWSSALDAGAIAAIVSPQVTRPPLEQALVLSSADMPEACAALANAFYEFPSRSLKMVGVTGTNGKTTTSHLIESLLNQSAPTALLGTLYARWPGYSHTATHTTPFAVELQAQLSQALQAGCKYGVMEVSSHALAQKRVLGCEFAVTVFTNLTQDHLDYHKDLDDYFEAKALLFSPTYLKGKAVINADDLYGQQLIKRLSPEQVWSYSIQQQADLYTTDLVYKSAGVQGNVHTPAGTATFQLPLVGQFNVANFLAAVGAGLALGIDLQQIVTTLSQFSGVPGRMQQIAIAPEQDISVIVDYAHTPDSLENMLRAARPFVKNRMICVFGCGGDRDRTKRPKMGAIAAELSDLAVVTSDNPRTEDPKQILEDILTGIPSSATPLVEADRRVAIHQAILQAQPGDSVLIAGKGHEDYQILGTEKIHFDDREEAEVALKQRYHVV
jgi:UDP-N-acetylmuramoyl-L-alanyl-D-glutamate--2,6-diaminopimelate ligase